MDHFISMYIDDELSLNEKIMFLEKVHGNRPYTDEAISLLKQEKELCVVFNQSAPEISLPPSQQSRPPHLFAWATAAILLLVLSFLAGTNIPRPQKTSEQLARKPHPVVHRRFVIHQRASEQVEISGSFTNWQRVALIPTGAEGYWEVTLQVPYGEHRYSFIIDDSKRLPDPTVLAKESDDFGTVNSIINVET